MREISKPFNGRNERTPKLTPKRGRIPTPHAAHPGTRIANKIPIDAKTCGFFDDEDKFNFALNTRRLKRSPNKVLSIKILMYVF